MDLNNKDWGFITRYTEFSTRSSEFGQNKDDNLDEPIEYTVERAKEALSGQIINLIGLNQDLQKVFKELGHSINAIEGYEDYFKADLTNVKTMLGEETNE
tara:strand:- start:2811 stop:3110 length:300 start_codon:yes stop_codon:yes gene_type:complete